MAFGFFCARLRISAKRLRSEGLHGMQYAPMGQVRKQRELVAQVLVMSVSSEPSP
jgi:hypothetical protein